MVGRQVILTNRSFTPEEMYEFMNIWWDKEQYNSFVLGSPTDMNQKLYVMLPATDRYLVIVYSRAAGGLFSKENKVVLSVANTPSGAREMMMRSIPTRSVVGGAMKIGSVMSSEQERKGPAEQVLQQYTAYMRQLLGQAGYLK